MGFVEDGVTSVDDHIVATSGVGVVTETSITCNFNGTTFEECDD